MDIWYPQQILAERGVRITETEREIILGKMPPPKADGHIYADGVFEGGGVRGIAFLGALRCCADLGLRWRKLAGTSAGAITAAFMAANFSIDELEQILGTMDYKSLFLAKKTSPLILNGNPADDLQFPWWMVLCLAISGQNGQYSLQFFQSWLREKLASVGVRTFADVKDCGRDKELKVVVSDVTRGQMLVLPEDLARQYQPDEPTLMEQLGLGQADELSVAEAVRLSLSIPLFFEPGQLGSSAIVDGGVLSNFPLWIYDVKPPGMSKKRPRWFTFGFRFVDEALNRKYNVKGPLSLMSATIRTMAVARDRYHLREADSNRVIEIDVSEAKVGTTDFNLSSEKRLLLYLLGYKYTKEFFLSPEFSWPQHLISRGFSPEELSYNDLTAMG
jgi:NTE family protein